MRISLDLDAHDSTGYGPQVTGVDMRKMENYGMLFRRGIVFHSDRRQRRKIIMGGKYLVKVDMPKHPARGAIKAFSRASQRRLAVVLMNASAEFRSFVGLTYHALTETWETDPDRNKRVVQSTKRVGHKLIGKLTRVDAWAFRRWLEDHERKLGPQSVHHVLSDFRCLLRWCEDVAILERSPFPRGIMPRLQERPPDRLEPKEVRAVLGVPEPYGFVIRLGLGTGLRWGELRRAQAGDVQNGLLVVHHTKSRKVRRIPLTAGLRQELRSRVGKLVPFVEPGAFANQVRKHSGVKRFHVHQLRHTLACAWLERGGSLAALQQLLGHSSIVTTQRYGRISDDMIRAEVERVGCVPTRVPSAEDDSDEAVVQ